jgi:hypothetical protein
LQWGLSLEAGFADSLERQKISGKLGTCSLFAEIVRRILKEDDE